MRNGLQGGNGRVMMKKGVDRWKGGRANGRKRQTTDVAMRAEIVGNVE